MTLQEILADRTKYADDYKVKIGDVEVAIGELRSAQEATTRKQQELSEREELLKAQQEQAAKLYADVLKAQETAAAAAQSKNPIPDPTKYDIEADPFIGSFVKKTNQALTEYQQKLEQATKTQQQMAAYYAMREWKKDFASLQDRPKDLTMESLVKKAAENKFFDEAGIPDIRRAFDALYEEPRRMEKLQKEAEARGYDKARKEAAAASTTRTRSITLPNAAPDANKFNDLDSAINAAKADSEIQQLLNGLNLADV